MLAKHVFSTIVYYDVMEYPLTSFEVWKHLLVLEEEASIRERKKYTLAEVVQSLKELCEKGRIVVSSGFYILPGRQKLSEKRIREEKISVAKLKRARFLIRFLSWVPYVRMIAVAGSLAMKKGEEESDWDFFVVLRKGRIWLGRTFLTAVLQCIGKRRHGQYVKNRACLNYFVTEEELSVNPKDAFSANEYRYLFPVFDRGVHARFELENRWIATFKPQFEPTLLSSHWTIRKNSTFFLRLQQGLEKIFDHEWAEKILGSWQRRKIERNPKTRLPGSFIETSDHALVFLPRPKGPQVFERFKIRLSESSHLSG